jgi:hypothetical protein
MASSALNVNTTGQNSLTNLPFSEFENLGGVPVKPRILPL